MSKLIRQIARHQQQKLPFVCFRKPRESSVKAYLCREDSLHYSHSYHEKGFLFAPFDDRKRAVIFPSQNAQILEESVKQYPTADKKARIISVNSDDLKHKKFVQKGIKAIQDGLFRKVVLSRKETLELEGFDCLSVFQSLLQTYSNAFVYLWYHPKVGMWIGATPERLVLLKNKQFKTMALAGTQAYNGNHHPFWGEKERQEHQFVVDYIVDQIQDPDNGIVLNAFEVSKTYTSKAGNLLHLKADIEGEIGDFNLIELIRTLHPTPAVCGLPKEAAKEFILESEEYQRDFYTGFLGEINVENVTELYVNLRCAEFANNKLSIYVGGGITVDSNPELEWLETIKKTQTIKGVL